MAEVCRDDHGEDRIAADRLAIGHQHDCRTGRGDLNRAGNGWTRDHVVRAPAFEWRALEAISHPVRSNVHDKSFAAEDVPRSGMEPVTVWASQHPHRSGK